MQTITSVDKPIAIDSFCLHSVLMLSLASIPMVINEAQWFLCSTWLNANMDGCPSLRCTKWPKSYSCQTCVSTKWPHFTLCLCESPPESIIFKCARQHRAGYAIRMPFSIHAGLVDRLTAANIVTKLFSSTGKARHQRWRNNERQPIHNFWSRMLGRLCKCTNDGHQWRLLCSYNDNW